MKLQSFIGQARTSIDDKGRTSFPKEFRRYLTEEDGDHFVISRGPSRSLVLYTVAEWNQFLDTLARRPQTQETQKFITQLTTYSHEFQLDAQNRISLTKGDMEHARLEGEVLFAPRRGKTCGLWNPSVFDAKYGLNTDFDYQEFDAGFFDDGAQGVSV